MAVSGETRHIPYQGVTGALRTGSVFAGRGLRATGFPRGEALRGPLRRNRCSAPAGPPQPPLHFRTTALRLFGPKKLKFTEPEPRPTWRRPAEEF